MYPAKEAVVAGSACAVEGVSVSLSVCVSGVGVVIGGVATGTPVREWRRGGMMEVECEVGVRTRRRRGLRIVFGEDILPGGGLAAVICNCVVVSRGGCVGVEEWPGAVIEGWMGRRWVVCGETDGGLT